jgi:hypothetical protein
MIYDEKLDSFYNSNFALAVFEQHLISLVLFFSADSYILPEKLRNNYIYNIISKEYADTYSV